MKLTVELSPEAANAWEWLRSSEQVSDKIVSRAILALAALESGDDNRCDDLVDEYVELGLDVLGDLGDNADRMVSAFMREEYALEIAMGEVED
jgi:hypothetical protein